MKNKKITTEEMSDLNKAFDDLIKILNDIVENPRPIILGHYHELLRETWAEISSEGYSLLFCLDFDSAASLDDSILLEVLRKEFDANEIFLSSNAAISVLAKGDKWGIYDDRRMYTVRKEKDKLSVYLNFYHPKILPKDCPSNNKGCQYHDFVDKLVKHGISGAGLRLKIDVLRNVIDDLFDYGLLSDLSLSSSVKDESEDLKRWKRYWSKIKKVFKSSNTILGSIALIPELGIPAGVIKEFIETVENLGDMAIDSDE